MKEKFPRALGTLSSLLKARLPAPFAHPDAPLIGRLRERLLGSLRDLDDGAPYALLDFPWYANVGDSVLWMGARRALRSATGRAPSYAAGQGTFSASALARAMPRGTIYLLGGGNFGDLYPNHQDFRLQVLRDCPQHRVVQLPQSLHFTSAASLQRMRHAITEHGQFVLMVRDRPSAAAAADLTKSPVLLVPDLAFALGERRRRGLPSVDVLALRRRDIEVSMHDVGFWEGVDRTEDWPSAIVPWPIKRVVRRLTRATEPLPILPARADLALLDYLANRRVAFGERMLSQGHYVKTDRLHGHLMCMLLGIPHDVIDNSTGKISAMIDAWTAPSTLLRGRPER